MISLEYIIYTCKWVNIYACVHKLLLAQVLSVKTVINAITGAILAIGRSGRKTTL